MEKERVDFDGPGVTMDTKRKRESKEEKGPGKKKGKKKHHEEKSEGKTGRRDSDHSSEERPKKKEKRDLKPDNILLDHEGHIKIADFGMAKQNIFGSRTITGQAGTLDYMAPEIFLNKGYNAAVDWWACGVIICEMATGEIPFPDDSDDEDFSDEPNIPSWLSKDLKDLLRKLLERNPDRRLGVYGNIRQHPFFSAIDWEELEWPPVPPPFDLETVSTWLLKYLHLLNRK
ncbi:hypothetical protein XELAEV_18029584mg [Xenopus laevis]|uniref:Protein kinase domain-containing protein n=1 Tax=Xenopus laevis TaxID=8355 RepID=A0A974CS78_XENLA|nr:hypothetical protein XELAEV_18029584mg [Xenopus laevis]